MSKKAANVQRKTLEDLEKYNKVWLIGQKYIKMRGGL